MERVREIMDWGALHEGVDGPDHRANFHDLWQTIHAKDGFGWEVNPWVFVVDFKRTNG